MFSFLYQMPTIRRPPFWAQLQKLREFSDFFFRFSVDSQVPPSFPTITYHHYQGTVLLCFEKFYILFCKFKVTYSISDSKASAYSVGDLRSILGREDSLEKEMATHSSTLAWRLPWTEEPGGLQSGVTKSPTGLSDFTFTFILFIIKLFNIR